MSKKSHSGKVADKSVYLLQRELFIDFFYYICPLNILVYIWYGFEKALIGLIVTSLVVVVVYDYFGMFALGSRLCSLYQPL